MATTTPSLNLQLHQRTALVSVDTARAVLGVDIETILDRIDSGIYQWAFDISPAPDHDEHKREIRIWGKDIIAPGMATELNVAIDCIIGTQRDRLRGTEVAHLLLCSGATIMRLVDQKLLCGPLTGHTQHITRASLAQFLIKRRIS